MGPRQKVKGACGFCHLREQTPETGKLYKTYDDEVAAHLNCMLLSSKLVTPCTPEDDSFGGFSLKDVKKEIGRGRRLKCFVCKRSGATIGCDIKRCKKSFHYLCAKNCGCEVIEDEDKEMYKIYCVRHKENRTSNVEEDIEDSNGANISTDDGQTDDNLDDVTDDSSFDGDNENDLSLKHNKEKERRDGKKEREKMEIFEYLKLQTRNGVEDTPKRNMLKRAKTSTPSGPPAKVSNGGSSNLDVSGNNTVAGPSSVLGAKSKSQDGSRVATGSTPIRKRRRPIFDTDSSASSPSRITPIPMEIAHEGPNAENQKVENSKPEWIKLLSGYHARVTQPSHTEGQNNTMRPRNFWQLCRAAKCTDALFQKIITSLESRMQRIKSQAASEDDYAQVFDVLMTTGCLQTIATDLQQEIKDEKEALEREKADLFKKEQLLNDIIPTLNRSSTSEVSNETAENIILESQ